MRHRVEPILPNRPVLRTLISVAATLLTLWLHVNDTDFVHVEGVQQATGLELLFLGAVALAVVAGLLLPKPKVSKEFDNRPPTTSQRGDQLPYVIGRRSVNPAVLWVGRRTSREERVGGGKKKGGGGGGSAKQTIYYEDGVHAFLGPGSGIFAIYQGATVIFQGPISADSTPSGSVLTDIEGNSFAVYWGEVNQPVNTSLAQEDALGVASGWPFYFYIHWLQRRLGSSATWGQISYDIECRCVGTSLPDSDCTIPDSVPGAEDGGQNGAHIIYQLFSGFPPHGVAMPTDHIDFGSLKALGILIEQEQFGQNILVVDDATCDQTTADLLNDLSVLMPEHKGRLVFMPIRPGLPVHVINPNVIVSPLPSLSIIHGEQQPDSVLFLFPDVKHQHRDTDIPTDDDSSSTMRGRKSVTEQRIPTVTNQRVATVVADRRKQILLSDGNQVGITVGMTARRLVAGHVITIPEIGEVRVTGNEIVPGSGKTALTASINSHALEPSAWDPVTPPLPPPNAFGSPDDSVVVFEAPRRYASRELALAVIRGRDDGSASNATVWVSLTGSNYVAVGNQNPSAASGRLGSDLMALPQRRIVEEGPIVALSTAAANKVLDLSTDEESWRNGRQLCIIGDEIMYLRRITALGGGNYQLEGLIRGRLHTQARDHVEVSETRVYIIPANDIVLQQDSTWGVGATLHVKCVPAGVSIDAVDAVILPLTGKAIGPPPVDNLHWTPAFDGFGIDLDFTWDYSANPGLGMGAGELPAGAVMAAPVVEGQFKVEVLSVADNVKRTVFVSTPSWTYTSTDRLADIGNDFADFKLRISNVAGTIGGYTRTYEVDKET